jgi:hypothetical protein
MTDDCRIDIAVVYSNVLKSEDQRLRMNILLELHILMPWMILNTSTAEINSHILSFRHCYLPIIWHYNKVYRTNGTSTYIYIFLSAQW